MLRNTKILSIMPTSMSNVLKSPYKLKHLLNQVYTTLKNHLYLLHTLSHDILVCFIGLAIHWCFDRYVRSRDLKQASQDGGRVLIKFHFTNILLIDMEVLKLSAKDFLM